MQKHMLLFATMMAAWVAIAGSHAQAEEITFITRSREAVSNEVSTNPVTIDSSRLGVVVVDMWNFHWSPTAAARVGAMVPRMEAGLAALREMGVQILYCPTDVADSYVGTPQRESVFTYPLLPLPEMKPLDCPAAPWGPGDVRQDGLSPQNWGWDGMDPRLSLHDDDLMPNNKEQLYAICKAKGIDTLIYMGVHTQVCLLGKDIGLANMKSLGFQCILARDLTDAHPKYDPAAGLTPDDFTAEVVAHFERHLCPTINLKDELKRMGRWPKDEPVDPVRFCPWGTAERPHIFDDPFELAITSPWHKDAEIRFTTDGSPPTTSSNLYKEFITIKDSVTFRAQTFKDGKPTGIESSAVFIKRGPQPPVPHVYLDEVKPTMVTGPGHSHIEGAHRSAPYSSVPRNNQNNRGQPMKVFRQPYERGLGMQAPSRMMFDLDPQWKRFVAVAGCDDNIVDQNLGSRLAMSPSVVFRVFIDSKLAAESPVMRINERPWHFDVPIPTGSKSITLTLTDAGNGNREDLGNWVNAGFILAE